MRPSLSGASRQRARHARDVRWGRCWRGRSRLVASSDLRSQERSGNSAEQREELACGVDGMLRSALAPGGRVAGGARASAAGRALAAWYPRGWKPWVRKMNGEIHAGSSRKRQLVQGRRREHCSGVPARPPASKCAWHGVSGISPGAFGRQFLLVEVNSTNDWRGGKCPSNRGRVEGDGRARGAQGNEPGGARCSCHKVWSARILTLRASIGLDSTCAA